MRVTVGLPFSDQGCYLEEAISSVIAQDHQDWELILVSDGASQETLGIARSQAAADDRIQLVEHASREGLAVRLNEIAEIASTEIIFRMDADDLMVQTRLSRQIEVLQRSPEIDVLGTRAFVIDERSVVRGLYVESELPSDALGYFKNGAFTHPTVAGRTNWFRNNPYDEQLLKGQDKELWLRTFRFSTFAKLTEPLLFYRINSRISRAGRQYSSRFNQEIVRRVGPGMIGERATRSYLRRARLKDSAFALAATANLTNRLMYQRKITQLSIADSEDARRSLSCALGGREAAPKP